MSLLGKKRYERTTHSLTFKTTRIASGAGDSTKYEPIELLQQWLDERPSWRVVSAQEVSSNYLGSFVTANRYFIVLEREV